MRGEVVKDVSARAPAERCFPGSISQMARDVDLIAFLEDERRGILGNVPVDGPIAGIDPIGLWSGVGVEVGREWAEGSPVVEINIVTIEVFTEPSTVGAIDSDTGVEGSCQEVGVVGRSVGHGAEAALGVGYV